GGLGRGRNSLAEDAAAEREQTLVARRTQHLVGRAYAFHGGPVAQILLDRIGEILRQVFLEPALRVVRRVDAAVGAPPLAAIHFRRALDAQADRADRPAIDRLALLDQDLVAHAINAPPSGCAIDRRTPRTWLDRSSCHRPRAARCPATRVARRSATTPRSAARPRPLAAGRRTPCSCSRRRRRPFARRTRRVERHR